MRRRGRGVRGRRRRRRSRRRRSRRRRRARGGQYWGDRENGKQVTHEGDQADSDQFYSRNSRVQYITVLCGVMYGIMVKYCILYDIRVSVLLHSKV